MPHGVRVLVVENHVRARQGLSLLLMEMPLVREVLVTDRAELAVRLARETSPDLVLMDIQLPGMDGLEATRQIRGLGAAIRVVAMSVDPDLRAEAMAAGADGFVDKIDLGARLAGLLDEAARGGGSGTT